jgi:choice-of-anchor A domain-containing protein
MNSYMVTGDSINGYIIESFGNSADSQAKVNCILKIQGPSEYALFGQNSISLKSGTTIRYRDGVTADENLKVGTNSTGDGAIYARMGVTIDGDVVVGPDGDPDHVIDSRNEATITGQVYAMTQAYPMNPVVVPHYLIELPSKGVIRHDITLTEDARCEGIHLNSSETITIDGPVVFYVDGVAVLENNAQIQIVDEGVNPDASLTMFLSKDFETKTGGSINNVTGDPKKLKIFGLAQCTDIDFLTDSTFYGSIYAPNAEVKMFNRVDVYGSIIAKSFLQQVAAEMFFDPSLSEATVYDEVIDFVVSQWYE